MAARRRRRGEGRTATGDRLPRRPRGGAAAVRSSARSSCTTRCVPRRAASGLRISRSSSSGSSRSFCGKSRSASPGTNTTLNVAAARLMRTADEDAPVAIGRRLLVERPQSLRENVARFLERDRTDGAHRAQLAEHAQHARRPAQHARRQVAEPLDPFAPRRAGRPRRERFDDRQRERREVRQILADRARG